MISYSTEVTSSKILSDNPLYQRTLKAYHLVAPLVNGNTLEIGFGEGYGVPIYKSKVDTLTLIDKSRKHVNQIKRQHKDCIVHLKKVPLMNFIKDNTFDTVISFQVIEHIKDYNLFLKEINRILKPGGKAYITTPNRLKSIARNPWHFKEFNYDEIFSTLKSSFSKFTIQGIQGSKLSNSYYDHNQRSVARLLKFDVLNLLNKLPSTVLKLPYEIGNRINRIQLLKQNKNLVYQIGLNDYFLDDYNTETLDFFCILEK